KIAEVRSGATGEATPVVRRTTPRVPPKRAPHHDPNIPDEYYDPDTGELIWPDENSTGIRDGFAKPPVMETLPEDTIIDRYAPRSGVDDTGRFLSPAGASYESRALPYIENPDNLTRYRVVRPLPVQSGTAAPWFGAPGGATQFKTGPSVGQLVKDGFLEVIP
ncbi:MAG: TNT domain-containing protein, partial [Pseudomonadota bacterium]